MDTLPFLELIDAEEKSGSTSPFVQHIQKIWEDRNQFEEAVQCLLNEHEQHKPRDIFY